MSTVRFLAEIAASRDYWTGLPSRHGHAYLLELCALMVSKKKGEHMYIEVPRDAGPVTLTIVVPAYNEAKRLPVSLPKLVDFAIRQTYPVRVLVVDDGSTDDTAGVVRGFKDRYDFVDLLQVDHGGKGHAVKAGMLAANSDYLFLCDADLSMPIDEVASFLPPQLAGYDVAIGSREAPGARRIGEPWRRHVMGRVFNAVVSALLTTGIKDTQAGFKCFRHAVAQDLFRMQTLNGWGFDVEILFLAQLRGYSIVEVPITWHYQGESKVRPLRDSIRMIREILVIRSNNSSGCYSTRPAVPGNEPWIIRGR